ncbi:MAG: hypothetical protein L0228_18490 [Planctomycetes bacterium]|nr:hypothetical protein [Planctomycetota bacterium]
MEAALLVLLLLSAMAGLFWSASRYGSAVKRYKTQLAVTDELQQMSQKQLDQVEEQHRRQIQIFDRQEEILSRVEELVKRLETRLPI